jgi:transposase
MAGPLVPDELWEVVEPLLPRQGQARKAGPTPRGRSRMSGRDHLRPPERNPVVDVAPRDGLRVRCDLLAPAAVPATPQGLEEASARPARPPRSRRPARLVEGRRRQPDVPRGFWGVLTGPDPTDRAKKGSKRHLLVDGNGVPLAVRITGAQRNESLVAMPQLDDVPQIRQPRGGRRRQPDAL